MKKEKKELFRITVTLTGIRGKDEPNAKPGQGNPIVYAHDVYYDAVQKASQDAWCFGCWSEPDIVIDTETAELPKKWKER